MTVRPMVIDLQDRPWWQTCDIPTFRSRVGPMEHVALVALAAELDAAIARAGVSASDKCNAGERRHSARIALSWYIEKRGILKPMLMAKCAPNGRETERQAKHAARVEKRRELVAQARAALLAGDDREALALVIDLLEAKNEGEAL